MPIISRIGRRSWRVRALLLTLYVVLSTGAVTMVYPFLLMIAGSTKTDVDSPDAQVIPRYLIDRSALWHKYAESLFNESAGLMRMIYGGEATSFRELPEPADAPTPLAKDWEEFCATTRLPWYSWMVGEVATPSSRGALPRRLRQFKQQMISQTGGDITRLNHELGTDFANWNAFFVAPEAILARRDQPSLLPFQKTFREFRNGVPFPERYYFSIEGFYKTTYLQAKYGHDLRAYNLRVGTHYQSWAEVHLPRQAPVNNGPERAQWEEFTRHVVNLLWVRATPAALEPYHRYLQVRYSDIGELNRWYHTTYRSFNDVPLVAEPEQPGPVVSDWISFVEGWQDPKSAILHQAPLETLRIQSVEFQFRDWLQAKYGGGERLDVLPPQAEVHYRDFLHRTGAIRSEFTWRNYISVWDCLARHGRGIRNTVIYCSLAIIAALIFNPLAAYALSRYRPATTYQLLLFLMLTMAFPPMVTQIPSFLMLREFGLLNTFAALILPGLANGYSIFLLKGFFDSLPKELYESATIDGAGEVRIFLQITMSLSTPILAVTALGAFNGAYSNFMMAVLVCQDEKMWTLMPWLFQLQQRSGEGVMFASFLIGSIPTLLVFAMAQSVIMRAVVIPVEK